MKTPQKKTTYLRLHLQSKWYLSAKHGTIPTRPLFRGLGWSCFPTLRGLDFPHQLSHGGGTFYTYVNRLCSIIRHYCRPLKKFRNSDYHPEILELQRQFWNLQLQLPAFDAWGSSTDSNRMDGRQRCLSLGELRTDLMNSPTLHITWAWAGTFVWRSSMICSLIQSTVFLKVRNQNDTNSDQK